ncbi:MAG: DUF4867 family protein [Lacrimispora sp.]|uniref:DUF4867 family protein n=1 Tax=Lacrimispora sp. TaxID=2719234 RepID=UPI0039E526FE
MKIYDITSPEFNKYGAIVQGYDFSELLTEMRKKSITEHIKYVASDPVLETLPIFRQFANGFFGGMPVELGYCMGHNQKLNALEYHRDSEVNISVTDYIVLLGCKQDLDENFNYDTAKIEAFYIPAGLAVEFYATTLHYCACHVQEGGYSHATFLPRGTNCPWEEGFIPETEEDRLLVARNKWLLVHEDGGFDGALPVKLKGENCTIMQSDWKARE